MPKLMLMPKLATILLLSCMPLSVYARKITFSYDAAGNRVKRELVIPQSNKSLRESTDTDQNYYDLVGERTVTISQRSTGLIDITINNLMEDDSARIDVYSISGMTIVTASVTDMTTTVDLTSYPMGVYILRVTIKGNHTIWKITKQ